MNEKWLLGGMAILAGVSMLLAIGCESISNTSSDDTDYSDNSRFYGSYTGSISGADSGVEGSGASDSGTGRETIEIGSDFSRKDEGWYVYIPATGGGETFTSTNGGSVYTETVSVSGSTLSFHIQDEMGEADVVFSFHSDYNAFTYHNNQSWNGTMYVWTGEFYRLGEHVVLLQAKDVPAKGRAASGSDAGVSLPAWHGIRGGAR